MGIGQRDDQGGGEKPDHGTAGRSVIEGQASTLIVIVCQV